MPLVETGEDLLMAGFDVEVTDRFEVVVSDLPEDRIRSIFKRASMRSCFPCHRPVAGDRETDQREASRYEPGADPVHRLNARWNALGSE